MSHTAVEPSLAHLRLFCFVVRELRSDPKRSYRDMSTSYGISLKTFTDRIALLEGRYGSLIATLQRSPVKRLTLAADELYERAEKLLTDHAKLREWHPTGATQLKVGVTNAILVYVMPSCIQRFAANGRVSDDQVRLSFVETDVEELADLAASGKVDFSLGPRLGRGRFGGAIVKPVGPSLPSVLICHWQHPWAIEDRKSVSPSELSNQRLIALPSAVQPGGMFDNIDTDPAQGGERMIVTNYTSIVACVRMGVGVSIVPRWPEAIANASGEQTLRVIPMPKAKRTGLAAYLPPGGEDALSSPAKRLLSSVRQWVQQSLSLETSHKSRRKRASRQPAKRRKRKE